MAPWVRDLDQDPGHKLHLVHPLAFCRLELVMPPLTRVDDLVRAGREAQPGALTGERIM